MRMRSMPLPLIRKGARKRGPSWRGLGRTALLTLLTVLAGHSGGIVRRGACRLGRRGTAFRLRLASLEVFSQGRAQTPLSSQLLCMLVTTAHGNNIRSRREVSEDPSSDRRLNGARLRHFWPCGKDRRARFNRHFRNRTRRCRSSVVEHPLGKGEVVSSILTGSTRKSPMLIGCLQHSPRGGFRRCMQNDAATCG